MALDSSDPIFANLTSIKTSLSANNQKLVPNLISIFSELHNKMLSAFDEKLDDAVARLEQKFEGIIHEKDAKIEHLEAINTELRNQVTNLDERLDALNAYTRKDTIIVSGALPPALETEDTHAVVRDLLAQKFPGVTIDDKDISVAHRLQAKKPLADGSRPPPNIIAKLVRRSLKIQLIKASRDQNKNSPNKVFINESLSPQRNLVLQTLIKLKKVHKVVKGVTSHQGEVYVFMAHQAVGGGETAGGQHRDTRHRVNTMEQLKKFCLDHLHRPLEEFLVN